MPGQNDYLPFAADPGADVMPQADWAGLDQRLTGFITGTARTDECNKAWRQSSIMAYLLAQFAVDTTGSDMLDTGSAALPTLLATLKQAIQGKVVVNKVAAYAVQNGDNGKKITLGGNTFFQVTMQAAAAYDANFSVELINTDAAAGKAIIATNGFTSFPLWPGQSVTLKLFGAIFAVEPSFQRYAPGPAGPNVIYVDFVNGSDNVLTNDGLALGAGRAWKTVQNALLNVLAYWDCSNMTFPIIISMQADDPTQIHWSPHGDWLGVQGGVAITVDGNNHAMHCANACVQVYFGARIAFRRLSFRSDNSDCIIVDMGGLVYLLDGISFFGAGPGSNDIVCLPGSRINIGNNYFVSGAGRACHMVCDQGRIEVLVPIAVTFGGDIAWGTAFIFGINPGTTNVGNVTWSLGGHTMVGKKFDIQHNHVLEGSAAVPGTLAGTASTGAQAV